MTRITSVGFVMMSGKFRMLDFTDLEADFIALEHLVKQKIAKAIQGPALDGIGRIVMGWSAAATLLGDSPPGTRLREGFYHFVLAKHHRKHPMNIHTIGIDLGKTSFHLVGLSER